jgi:hypothetical protein
MFGPAAAIKARSRPGFYLVLQQRSARNRGRGYFLVLQRQSTKIVAGLLSGSCSDDENITLGSICLVLWLRADHGREIFLKIESRRDVVEEDALIPYKLFQGNDTPIGAIDCMFIGGEKTSSPWLTRIRTLGRCTTPYLIHITILILTVLDLGAL